MKTIFFNQWLSAILILLAFSATLIMLSLYQRRFAPPPETVRKIFHITMGLSALAFPFLIADAWLGFVIAALAIALLWAVRKFTFLQKYFGSVCNSVQRRSHGEMYFAAGLAAAFSLAKNNFAVYASCVLVLTLADAAAALIGVRWGKHCYASGSGQKSWEGSISFFSVAVACIHAPLQLLTPYHPLAIFMVSVTTSLLLTVVEAFSQRGLDNVLLPLCAYFLLTNFLPCSVAEILVLLLYAVLCALTFFILRRRGQSYAAHF